MPDIFQPGSSEPYRPPNLQQRVSAAVGDAISAFRTGISASTVKKPTVKVEPEVAPQSKTDEDPAGRALPDANFITPYSRQWKELFAYGTGRNQRYADYMEMDSSYIEAMLDALVDSVLVSDDGKFQSFQVQARGAKIQTVLDELVESTNLIFFIRDILRNLVKMGDEYVGFIWDSSFNIVDLDNPPPEQMYVGADEHLRLLTGTERGLDGRTEFAKAYQQKNGALATVAAWHPFEMLHLKWRPSKRRLYSERSFLEGFRADWRKMNLIEESIVIHRLTRAAPRLAHSIDVTGKSVEEAEKAVDAFISDLRNRKMADGSLQQHMMSVDEDYVMGSQYRPPAPDGKMYPALNSIKLLDPRNTGLNSLEDLTYLRKKLFSRIPSEIVGVMADREDISTQDIAASRLYSYCQYILEHQLLRPMFDMQLTLRGFVPEKKDYGIVFPDVKLRSSWRFSDSQFRASMAEANEIDTGTNTRKYIAMAKHNWTEEQWNEHVKQFELEQKVFAPPEPTLSGSGGGNVPAKSKKITQVRKGQNSESTDTPSDESSPDTARREYAESVLPLLKLPPQGTP